MVIYIFEKEINDNMIDYQQDEFILDMPENLLNLNIPYACCKNKYLYIALLWLYQDPKKYNHPKGYENSLEDLRLKCLLIRLFSQRFLLNK